MQMTKKSVRLAACGAGLLVLGAIMSAQHKPIRTTRSQAIPIPGTKTTNAVVGGVTGGVAGGVIGFLVGGVGIVLMGTGVGLPAGAAMIAAASGIGAGGGALVGAASGTSDTTKTIDVVTVTQVPMFPAWVTTTVVIAGIVFLVMSFVDARRVANETLST